MHSIKEILRSQKMRRSMPDGMRFLMHRIEKPDDERQTDLQHNSADPLGVTADATDEANNGAPARTLKVKFENQNKESRIQRRKVKR
ncbi:MAG TPA: hypothetical protein VF644_02855 [Pyrinomonadaceae bacterium]|jgi:hypothetical protein